MADDPRYSVAKGELAKQMSEELNASGDPRAHGEGDEFFDKHPYLGDGPKHPNWKKR